ncbi:uncharacterized protein LOC103708211 isoform X1 [Phoenix dactylifera]|uniref:Uncharacterized protein LOC103708211 isoform X1 n=1 Tax=Phoenix dactylifera TaxID=42345 RepID=A0A8B9A4T0_PHODC|nr:uncharacterized protein LOC103708211 isoform X1 [Phoenix dactylifera]XP_038981646.1 uncharacterized protein LOC103708211 isoform X1 [Phoenix dactylifera]
MRLHARTLVDLLPKTQPQPPPAVSTLLFEPSSRSLALMLSDSSCLLYPSFSPFSSPPPPTAVPPVSTAACFLRLLPSPAAAGHVIFLAASPLASGSAVQLRAWILLSCDLFAPARLNFKSDRARSALALPLPHGLSVRLAASTNVFVLHSLAANQIWVFVARLPGDPDDGGGGHPAVDLMKCAVVDLVLPVYSVAVSMGFLLLGEMDGVRVFLLRPLIKGEGRVARRGGVGQKRLSAAKGIDSVVDACKKGVLNGVVVPPSSARSGPPSLAAGKLPRPEAGCCCNDRGAELESVVEKGTAGDRASYKLKTLRLSQNSSDYSFFVVMTCSGDVQNSKNAMGVLASAQAVSIHALSQKKFLILDSAGDLHVLSMHNTVKAPEGTAQCPVTPKDAHMNHLDHTMKVQMLAVLPDISTKMQVFWVSDGGYSVHMMSIADIECPVSENDKNESKQKAVQISAIEAIFTSEKIQDILPLSANAVLILGQGSIFAYATA